MSNNDFLRELCKYYGYPYFEESEDPLFDELTSKFDYYAKNGKYHMTYSNMKLYLDVSYSFLTKKIPQYVENGDILRFGSKNKAEFVLPKYDQQYFNQKQKLDIEKLKPIVNFQSIIDLNTYVEKLQLNLIPPNSYGRKLFEEWLETYPSSNPIVIPTRRKYKSSYHYYKYLYYKSGKIVIYINFNQLPILATLENFSTLFDILRYNLLKSTNLPYSFIISQFKGFRKPFEERPKQPINIDQSFNLPDLLSALKGG